MIPASDNFIKTMKSPMKQLYVKLEIYDSNMVFIKEITQRVSNDIGTLSIDSDRPIRRSFTLKLDNSNNEFDFGEDKTIWIDKRIKLFIGLKLTNGEIEYIPQGVFVLTDPESRHTLEGKTVTITAVDKGFFFTDKRGKFINEQIIQANASISDSIKIIAQNAGESMFNFDSVSDTVPYELTYDGTTSRWDAIQELASLAKCSVFFDVYGYLRLKKIDLNKFETEPHVWEYKYGDPKEKLYAGNIRIFDDSELANHIRVIGGSSQTADVVYDLVVDENDPNWTGNPYSIQSIGRWTYFHNQNSPDSLITTTNEAKWRAKFELMNRLGFAENVQLSISPNYLHDADDVIWIEDNENGIAGAKYLIKSISLPISPDIMAINCLRYRKLIDDWESF